MAWEVRRVMLLYVKFRMDPWKLDTNVWSAVYECIESLELVLLNEDILKFTRDEFDNYSAVLLALGYGDWVGGEIYKTIKRRVIPIDIGGCFQDGEIRKPVSRLSTFNQQV